MTSSRWITSLIWLTIIPDYSCMQEKLLHHGPWDCLSQIFLQIFPLLPPLSVWSSIPPSASVYTWPSSSLLFSVPSVCTYSQGYICTCVWRSEVNGRCFPYHSLPCRVRQGISLSLKPTIRPSGITNGLRILTPPHPASPSPCCLSTGITMSAQLLLGCWGSELNQVLTFPQQVLYGQLSPESETPFSKTSAFSCDTRTELRVARRTDKALPLCCLSSQGTVSVHACFQGALPLSEQRRTRKSSSKGSCQRRRTLPSQFLSSLRDDLKPQIYTNENVLKLKN